MGGEGGNLGPGKVQTSNVLQNMEYVGFSLWAIVGFCLFRGGFLSASLPCLVISKQSETFLSLLFNSYSRKNRAKKPLNSLLS